MPGQDSAQCIVTTTTDAVMYVEDQTVLNETESERLRRTIQQIITEMSGLQHTDTKELRELGSKLDNWLEEAAKFHQEHKFRAAK
jgi:DNA-binding transcriptional regulator YhcF (GntR family)